MAENVTKSDEKNIVEMSDKDTLLDGENNEESASSKEVRNKKPSNDTDKYKSSDETPERESSNDIPKNNSENGDSTSSENSESIKDEDELDTKDVQKEFIQNQEMLLQNVVTREQELSEKPQLKPCNSCEFLDPYSISDATCCWGMCRLKKLVIREFWIVSAPGDETREATFDKLNRVTLPKKLSINYKFHIPNFRTGTINELMYLSEELSKLDTDSEGIVHKLVQFMYSVFEDKKDRRKYFEVNDLDVVMYVIGFTWNSERFPVERPLSVIKDIIRSQFRNLEEDLKVRVNEHKELDTTLQKIERQKTGNLFTRTLADIVKKDDFILESEYLVTLLVIVPLHNEKEWMNSYLYLSDMVVPNSSVKIFSDKTHSLYSVVLYKKSVEEFKTNARKLKFIVRDFKYSEEEMQEEQDINLNIYNLKQAQIDVLYRWIKINFNDAFSAWIHVKAMRVFVESVLRYGLPVNFQAMLLVPLSPEKLSAKIEDMYKDIDSQLSKGKIKNVPGMLRNFGGTEEYFSYVFLTVSIDMFRKEDT